MNTTFKKLPKSQIEILFEIPAEKFKEYIEKATELLGKDFSVEGFRKGKVPREILEKTLSQERVLEEAIDLAVKNSYTEEVHKMADSKEEKIEVIGRPEIEVTKFAKGSPLEFKAKVAIMPDVVLSDYKKVASKIKPKEITVEEKEIEESLKFLQKSRAKTVEKPDSEPCGKGDFVTITFFAPQIENGKEQKDNFVMGEGRFIPGFEENIMGLKLNEEKEFSVTFPEQYFKTDLAGKEVNFKTKIISIAKIELPEINDEWVKSFGSFENLDALKKSIKEGMRAEKTEEQKQKTRAEILEKIETDCSFEVPDVLVEVEKERMLEELKAHLQSQFKTSFSDYLERIKKTEKEIIDSFSEHAVKRVKNFLILREIAKKENIIVSEKEVDDKTNEFLKQYQDIKKAEKELDLNGLKEYYKEVLSNEKVFNLLENL